MTDFAERAKAIRNEQRLAKVAELRAKAKLLTRHATHGHEPYIVELLLEIIDLLEQPS